MNGSYFQITWLEQEKTQKTAVVGKHSSHFLQQNPAALCHHKGTSLHVMPPRKGHLISLKMSFFISSLLTLVSLHLSMHPRWMGLRRKEKMQVREAWIQFKRLEKHPLSVSPRISISWFALCPFHTILHRVSQFTYQTLCSFSLVQFVVFSQFLAQQFYFGDFYLYLDTHNFVICLPIFHLPPFPPPPSSSSSKCLAPTHHCTAAIICCCFGVFCKTGII